MNKISSKEYLFSVLIPVYNVEKYLSECLDSVLNQTYNNYEIVIIDDGSTDKSGEICDEFVTKDSRIIVYHQPNQGLMMTRKTGLLYAKGDYCLFLDSDDTYESKLLAEVNHFLMMNECDLLFFNKNSYFDGKKEPVSSFRFNRNINSKVEVMGWLFKNNSQYSIFTKVLKREFVLSLIDKVYISINYAEDLLQTVHFIANASSIGMLDINLYNYRIRKSSMIHKMDSNDFLESLDVQYKISDILQSYELNQEEVQKYYYIRTINDVMDNVFKLNHKSYSNKDKVKILQRLRTDEKMNKLISSKYVKQIKLYNRVRLSLLKKKAYRSLLFVDSILYGLQSVIKWYRKENYFD